jgi:glycerol-3-phosphate dehydrogenase
LPLLEPRAQARLNARYGAGSGEIVRRYAGNPQLFAPLGADCEALAVEVVHAIRAEMAITLSDIVCGRLGLGGTGRPAIEVVRRCAELAAGELGWTATETATAQDDCERCLTRTVPDFLRRGEP